MNKEDLFYGMVIGIIFGMVIGFFAGYYPYVDKASKLKETYQGEYREGFADGLRLFEILVEYSRDYKIYNGDTGNLNTLFDTEIIDEGEYGYFEIYPKPKDISCDSVLWEYYGDGELKIKDINWEGIDLGRSLKIIKCDIDDSEEIIFVRHPDFVKYYRQKFYEFDIFKLRKD